MSFDLISHSSQAAPSCGNSAIFGIYPSVFCSYDSVTELYCIAYKVDSTYKLLSFKYMLELIFTSWLSETKRSYPMSDQQALTHTQCYWRDSVEAHWQTFYLSVYNIVASNSLNWVSMKSLFELWTTSSGVIFWSKRFVNLNPWITWTYSSCVILLKCHL